MKEFTQSATFVVPTGVTKLVVEAWGAGGGGGAGAICAPFITEGGHGGAGAYSRAAIPVVDGAYVTITIGQGGVGGNDNNRGNGAKGGDTIVASGNFSVTSGGGSGGGAGQCGSTGSDGAPGMPDPKAFGRGALIYPEGEDPNDLNYADFGVTYQTWNPAPGTVQPLGGFGGLQGSSGTNGYVLIQW